MESVPLSLGDHFPEVGGHSGPNPWAVAGEGAPRAGCGSAGGRVTGQWPSFPAHAPHPRRPAGCTEGAGPALEAEGSDLGILVPRKGLVLILKIEILDDFSRIFSYSQLSHDLPLYSASPFASNMPLLFCSSPWFPLSPSPSVPSPLPLLPHHQASFLPTGSQGGSDSLWGQFTCVILKGEYGQGSGPAGLLLAALEILRKIRFVILGP